MFLFLDNFDGRTRYDKKVSKQRAPLKIALIVGAVIKVVFMLVGWVMSVTFPVPFDPYALVYFILSVVIGAFLAGLVVGFLAQNQWQGVSWGFASAISGTVFVAVLLSYSFPFPPGLFFFFPYLIFDSLALIGGAIGASINVRIMRIAVLLAVLAVASLAVPGLMFAPTRHSGDIVLATNETMTINRTYQQDGNIVAKDNATLIIRNAELIMYQVSREYSIEIRDHANLIAENAKFTIITSRYSQFPMSTIYVKDEATALFNKSDVVSNSIKASKSSHVTIIDCQFTYGSVQSYDRSSISILGSYIRSVSCQDFSTVLSKNSGVAWYDCDGNSSLLIEASNKTALMIITHGYVNCHNNTTLTVNNSTVDGVSAEGFHGKVCFDDSFVNGQISVDSLSDFYLCGNVTMKAGSTYFKGQMTRNYVVITSPKKQLNVSDRNTGKTLWNGTSDDFGCARFDLVFTQGNYTNRLLINGQDFNSTSTTPLRVN